MVSAGVSFGVLLCIAVLLFVGGIRLFLVGILIMNTICFTAQEVAVMLGVSRGQAYKLVKGMNEELAKQGYIVISGKVPKKYFSERYYGGVDCVVESEVK